jgi:phage I-like protein
LSTAQERAITELVSTKEQAARDLENELEKIVQLRNGLVNISDKIEKTELAKADLDEEILSLKEKNTAKKIEIDNEMRNKDRLEQELREQRVVVTIKSQEVVGKQEAVNKATEDISAIELQIKLQKQMIEKLLRDQESLGTRTVKLQYLILI